MNDVLSAVAAAAACDWRGQPAIRLRLDNGDSALVALQGAQVLSWICGGREQLFLSPRAVHDGAASTPKPIRPIRGGIPVCFPQFNQRGPLAKHGFARILPWRADAEEAQRVSGQDVRLSLRLADTEATRAVWPHAFEAMLHLQLAPGVLTVRLEVHNPGDGPLEFTAALHSYLRVPEASQMELCGLQGLAYWDAVADTHPVQDGSVRFGAEVDRVYPRAAQPLTLRGVDGRPALAIAQTEGFSETVVWNPGPALCATLVDMESDGWRQMLCVEAAAIDAPVRLAPGARWQAAQTLHATAAAEKAAHA